MVQNMITIKVVTAIIVSLIGVFVTMALARIVIIVVRKLLNGKITPGRKLNEDNV